MTTGLTESLDELKITSDELSRLKNAFKDPEFRKLFNEYAQELADPVNKKKYEEEIMALENQRGFDTIFINPNPHYCLKTRHWPNLGLDRTNVADSKEIKVFINICSCDKLEKPQVNLDKKNGKSGVHVNLPHSFAPPKEDYDKAKNAAQVIDVVYHPQAFELAQKYKQVCELLNITAIEGVEREFGLNLGVTKEIAIGLADVLNSKKRTELLPQSYHILKGVKYKGVARSTVIRKPKENQAQIEKANQERDSKDLKEAPHLNKLINLQNSKLQTKIKPTFKMTHGKNFDMSDCITLSDPLLTNSSLPDYLKLEVDLPGLTSVSQFDLDLSETHLLINCEKPIEYNLDLKLPFPIIEAEAEAKFDKTSQKLTLKMPINKSSISKKPTQSSAENPPAIINEIYDDKTSKKLVEEISPLSSSIPIAKSPISNGRFVISQSPDCSIKESSNSITPLIKKIKIIRVPPLQLSVPKDHRLMSAKFRQDPSSFTVLFCVKNAIPDSIQISWAPDPQSTSKLSSSLSQNSSVIPSMTMAVSLQTRGSGGFTIDWGLVLKCPVHVEEELIISSNNLGSNSELSDNLNSDLNACDDNVWLDAKTLIDIDQDENDEYIPPTDLYESGQEPKLLACNANQHNIVLVFEKPKPIHNSTELQSNWWPSIATGRSVGAGMEISEFHGLHSCLPLATNLLMSPFQSPRNSQTLLTTSHSLSSVPSKFASILTDSYSPQIISTSSSQFAVQEMSQNCLKICQISESISSENKILAPLHQDNSNREDNSHLHFLRSFTDSSLNIDQSSDRNRFLTSSSANQIATNPVKGILKQRTLSESSCGLTSSEQRIHHSRNCAHHPLHQHNCVTHASISNKRLDNDDHQTVSYNISCDCLLRNIINGPGTAALIRSASFSSNSELNSDSCTDHEIFSPESKQTNNPVYPPGLIPNDKSKGISPRRRVRSLCFDGLQSVSENEARNKIDESSSSRTSSISNTCQCVCGDTNFCCVASKGLTVRQRIRSVNFSRKDESMDFCPQDSIEVLHQAILNRRKKARKYERRRHHSFSESGTGKSPCEAQIHSTFTSQTGSVTSEKNPRKKRTKKKGKQLHFPPELTNQTNTKTPEISPAMEIDKQFQFEPSEPEFIPSSLTSDVIFELDES